LEVFKNYDLTEYKSMKTILITCLLFLTALAVRADLLFSDDFDYPDGMIETDGVWFAYAPTTPHQDAFVTNQLLILDQANYDAVAAPFTNNTGSSIVYASFNINVSSLPTTKGGYFVEFKDNTNDYVCRLFIDTLDTIVPGTYRLGVANYATSITTAGATNFPLDLATGITYQVVFSYDTGNILPGATLAINPVSEGDFDLSPAYGRDTTTNTDLQSINISQVGFSQYTGQGVATIGNVMVGTSYSDVVTNAPWKPIIGIAPQGTNIYSGYDVTLYVAASGTGPLTYQWLLGGSPLSDSANVSGSTSNVLTLTDLQATGGYSVIVSGMGSVTSQVATVSVDTTLTQPFFTLQPQGQTNAIGSTITLTAAADGTGPITYQWYFKATNSSTFNPVGTGTTLTLTGVTFNNSGLYYVTATGGSGAGQKDSDTVNVLVTPPTTVSLAYLHSLLLSTNVVSGIYNLANGEVFNVQGVVISFLGFSSTYSEYYIQDDTAGAFVFINGAGSTNVQPAGTLVNITAPAQQYYGALEIVPNVTSSTNSVTVISTNNPLPASTPLNLPLMATNAMSPYGIQVQGSLVTVTNVYIYASSAGAAVSGNFTTSSKTLYLFNQPYAAGLPYLIMYIYANNANFAGQPIPSYAYEITGAMGLYSPTEPELYPTRYEDVVTSLPPSFSAGITVSNGLPQVSWPAVSGSTYSLYSAPSLTGPWTQTFGLSYYPSVGAYTETNSAAAKFYRVSSP
jgi:Immunoglobulin domain/Family of unknown function (DUF5689)